MHTDLKNPFAFPANGFILLPHKQGIVLCNNLGFCSEFNFNFYFIIEFQKLIGMQNKLSFFK